MAFVVSLILGCSNDYEPGPIYLDTTGITIKCDQSTNWGDTFEVDGITYTIVNEVMLRNMVSQDSDVTKVCTSNINNMNGLFSFSEFNQDIGSWDVSHVTDMGFIFSWTPFNQDISAWDVGNVYNMDYIFAGTPFNQEIWNWEGKTS
ncbi:MAG: DUF285 domain-containing protein [Bacteroidia bacterium]|nr:DUF285 domain-containing protein [Bacteroidia bacterium]